MKEVPKDKIDDLITNGYVLDGGRYFNESIVLVRHHAASFLGFTLLTIVIGVILQFIPIIGTLISSFVTAPALVAGMFIYAYKVKNEENVEFSDFFKGFEDVGQLTLFTITSTFLYLIIFSPTLFSFYSDGYIDWYIALIEDPTDPSLAANIPAMSANTITIFFLNLIPLVYFSVAFLWAPHFIVFYKMGFWDAMETSRQIITKQWISVFLLMLIFIGIIFSVYLVLILIVAFLGIFGIILAGMAFVGFLLAWLCTFQCAIYLAFAEVMDLHHPNRGENDHLYDHLVD